MILIGRPFERGTDSFSFLYDLLDLWSYISLPIDILLLNCFNVQLFIEASTELQMNTKTSKNPHPNSLGKIN